MKRHNKLTGFIKILFLVFLLMTVSVTYSAAPPATVSIINPKPGTSTTPSVVSLRPTSNNFKVQVQVWNDVPWNSVTDYVNVGYCADSPPGSVNPETCTITWTANNTTPNANYNCGTNCGVFDFNLSLTAGTNYFVMARAYSASEILTGYSRDNRTGNDARYVYVSVKAAKTGTGTLLARDSSSQICIDCHNTKGHSSQTSSTNYSNWQTTCLECHDVHGTKNIYLIRDIIITPNSGNKTVTFYNTTGDALNSYVNSAQGASTTAICQVCHTKTSGSGTARWRNTGNSESPSHYGGAGTQRCADCHPHKEGFKGGGCNGCHDYDTRPANNWGDGYTQRAIEGFGAHKKHIDHIKTRFSILLDPNANSFGTGVAAQVCGTCHTNAVVDHSTGAGGGPRTINFGNGRYMEGSTNGLDGFSFVFGATNPAYNGSSGSSSSVAPKTCFNTSCHFQATPVWSAY